ncbi:MAG: amidase [Bacteroidetes bacterium]|nr:amidase [Bacteroidota bacterium]
MNYTSSLSLSESVNDIKTGKVGLEEYLNYVCDTIDAAEPFIHALLPEPGRRERLMREAGELIKKYPSAAGRPQFFGIPVGVKDIFRADGFPTKAGSMLPASLFEGRESSVVTTLKQNGALILGKTVTTEFAYFEPGPTCNPHQPSHTPGGSSSGSAAAVACGFVPLALGTQTIGSITRPASFCGVYGFKPSFQRIATDGVIPFSESADTIGFFTQDLAGLEMTAALLCKDWNTFKTIPERKPVIGIMTGSYLEQTDHEVRQFFESKIQQLENLGFKIIRLDVFRDIEAINRAHRSIIAAEFARVHERWFSDYAELYRKSTRELILQGRLVTGTTLENARKYRELLRAQLKMSTSKYQIDVWLSPSSCTAAPDGLNATGSPLMNLPWTCLGLPTISVPAGKTEASLPLGLQFAGSFMQDELLFEWVKKSSLVRTSS